MPVCIGDAPYIEVRFGDQPQFNGLIATVTFTSQVTGLVVETTTVPYVANSSVFIVYPGATVDAAGNPTDWPGWRFEASTGLWVLDPSDDYLREGLTVTIEVNPTATGTVEYPPATAACANPDNPPTGGTTTTTAPGQPTPVVLPPTQ